MATFKELSDAVSKVLSHSAAKASLQLNSPTRERAFEAYVFSLLIEAVTKAGGSVVIVGINSGKCPNRIVLRGSPGCSGQVKLATDFWVFQ